MKMKAQRILHIITTGESGGAQTHVYDLCINTKGKYEPLVATGYPGTLGPKLEQADIPVYTIPSLQREINIIKDIRAAREIHRLIEELRPDLICTHSSKAGFLGRWAARRSGVPTIFTAHGWAFTEGVPAAPRSLYKILERWAARWTNQIICVSDHDFELACRNGVALPDRMVTIHNGIPAGEPRLEQKRPLQRTIKVIMVARFSAQKDQPLLIQAISQIPVREQVELWLVGDGPLLNAARDYAFHLNIQDKVKFWGNRSDVKDLLAQADIFVLTSHWEGFPITILEAMRAGLPVIASDVGGCREAVVPGKTGYLIKPGDLKALAARLGELAENPESRLKMGLAGYNRFTENFTVEKMVEQTVGVYAKTLTALG